MQKIKDILERLNLPMGKFGLGALSGPRRLLAIEWDPREARVAVLKAGGPEATLEQAFAIPFPQRETGEAIAEAQVGSAILEALAARGLTRLPTLVAVGRASIELRVLSLPPAPPDEVPDLVRFQASKQFTTAGENWPLDYVPLYQDTESQAVLAAAISPDLVQQIRQMCAAAHLEPLRLVLRPFAAAALWRRSAQDSRCTLMVDPLTDEADLTVLVEGHVEFVRTVRLPSADNDEFTRVLAGEIRRTIGAASNQLRGQRVERIVVCGTRADHGMLQAYLAQQTGLEVEYFDPFALVALGSESGTLPTRSGRFAPLIGMLLDEAASTPHGIDFLHPRRRPPPANNRRRNVLIGATAAAVLLLVFFFQWWSREELVAQLAELTRTARELDNDLKKLAPALKDVKEVDEFMEGDVNWLDELYQLSERFLPSEEAISTEVNFSAQQKGGGQMLVEGYVKQASLVDALERKLRDDKHKVSASNVSFDERSETYPWRFKETVLVTIEDPEKRFNTKTGRSTAEDVPANDRKTPTTKSNPIAAKSSNSPAKQPENLDQKEPEYKKPADAKPEAKPVKGGSGP